MSNNTRGNLSNRSYLPSALVTATVLMLSGLVFGQTSQPLVPEQVSLHESAQAAIDAAWLTDEERSALRLFHGVWDERDLDSPRAQAVVALNAWDFAHPALADRTVSPEIRAEAMLRQGELRQAVALLEGVNSNRGARILAEAYESLGDRNLAEQAIDAPVKRLLGETTDDPAELTEGVRALVVRASLQGQPGRDYQTMMTLLGRAHPELDRLYWPAKLAEARRLIDKDAEREAIGALHETLSLNPRCAGAWFTLGEIALARFDFDSVQVAVERLAKLNPGHPLALLLIAQTRLVQDDPDGAMEVLGPLIERMPKLRPAQALIAATAALLYDDDAMHATITRYEELSPGSAVPYYVVGRYLSLNRQYEAAAQMLEEAIRRQPAWPAPQIELGLMELQSGRDANALDALQAVVQLDPFNKRAANSFFLLEELAGYSRAESEHFIIRYEPGVDQVMVDMMLEPLERIHEKVAARFGHVPDRKTVIELLPDHKRFAVRITGLPGIHTIAACTGPVIALEVPREGPPSLHLGTFDWVRVIGHEYTHTITLSQTRNRIPHWLTEAAAVSMEDAPRDYSTCQLLANAYHNSELFDLEDIKWAFVRPRRPTDRALAYAQGHWMVQYMNQRYGNSALVRLLGLYFDGVREVEAMPRALGVAREQFFSEFLVWAEAQIKQWGLAPEPSLEDLKDQLRMADADLATAMLASRQARLNAIANAMVVRIGQPADARSLPFTADRWPDLIRPPVEVSDETLAGWLTQYADHPDLLEMHLRRRTKEVGSRDESLIPLLNQYAKARPADLYPHKRLADIYLHSESPEDAAAHLQEIDRREEKTPVYALNLARLYRHSGVIDKALEKVTRAVQINPYNADNRELAAAIAVEAGRLEVAKQHILALTLIEPDRPRHRKRLDAIEALIAGQSG